MLTYAADFWPLFWAIIGAGAALTVLVCLMIATFSPKRFRPDGLHRPTRLLHTTTASRHGHEAPSGHLPKAA